MELRSPIPPYAVVKACRGVAPVWDESRNYWRNIERARRVIQFIEALVIPSGVGAGRKFKLRPWQKKFIRDIYEPCDADGQRIVRDAVLSMGRKNGKTAIIAALVLVHLVGPESVQNGEVYSGANDREQAAIVFKFAAQFVRASDILDHDQGGLCKVIDSTKRIVCYSNGSFYHALSREAGTKHGLNPTFCIYDELAQAKDRELYDTLNTGFGARTEPLFAVISTQSRDPQHILSELIDRGKSDLDPSVVCHLYAVDDDVSDYDYCEACDHQFKPPEDEKAAGCPRCGGPVVDAIYNEALWPLANPALGDFLTLDSVRKLANQAKASPSFEPSFRNLTLNQRVDMLPGVIKPADWRACYDPKCALIPGESIYLALDLSATTDLCAAVAVSAHDGSRLAAWFWKPQALIGLHSTRDRAPYEKWVKENYLFTAPGRDIDYDIVAQFVVTLGTVYNILGVAYDRWRIDVLFKAFRRLQVEVYEGEDTDYTYGIRFVEWGQGYRDMAPAIEALDKAVASRKLAHDGNPILRWCFSNAVVSMEPAGGRKLDKSKARFRIDGAVAAVMVLGLKARDMPDEDDDLGGFFSAPVGVN